MKIPKMWSDEDDEEESLASNNPYHQNRFPTAIGLYRKLAQDHFKLAWHLLRLWLWSNILEWSDKVTSSEMNMAGSFISGGSWGKGVARCASENATSLGRAWCLILTPSETYPPVNNGQTSCLRKSPQIPDYFCSVSLWSSKNWMKSWHLSHPRMINGKLENVSLALPNNDMPTEPGQMPNLLIETTSIVRWSSCWIRLSNWV